MDLVTLAGLISAFGIILAAIFLGGSTGTCFNVPSLRAVPHLHLFKIQAQEIKREKENQKTNHDEATDNQISVAQAVDLIYIHFPHCPLGYIFLCGHSNNSFIHLPLHVDLSNLLLIYINISPSISLEVYLYCPYGSVLVKVVSLN